MLVELFHLLLTASTVLLKSDPMRKIIFSTFLAFISLITFAQDKTLRVDYIFSGTDRTQEIALSEMTCFEGWAGRHVNMDKAPVRGNGQIIMSDASDGRVLYSQSFSTLFQEWQTTEESVHTRKAFENVFLLPMPQAEALVKVELYDFRGGISASYTHKVKPDDVLIRRVSAVPAPHRYLSQGGSVEECIDVAIVAEGYTSDEMELFYSDAKEAMEAILSHKPFDRYKDRFNFVAVAYAGYRILQ